MDDAINALKQRVVYWTDADGKRHAYSSAYTDEQVEDAKRRCIADNGEGANPQDCLARDFARKQFGP